MGKRNCRKLWASPYIWTQSHSPLSRGLFGLLTAISHWKSQKFPTACFWGDGSTTVQRKGFLPAHECRGAWDTLMCCFSTAPSFSPPSAVPGLPVLKSLLGIWRSFRKKNHNDNNNNKTKNQQRLSEIGEVAARTLNYKHSLSVDTWCGSTRLAWLQPLLLFSGGPRDSTRVVEDFAACMPIAKSCSTESHLLL